MRILRSELYNQSYFFQHFLQGVSKPFNEVIRHFGDPHAFGQSPVSFMRQVRSFLKAKLVFFFLWIHLFVCLFVCLLTNILLKFLILLWWSML